MANIGDKINIICLESEALKSLVRQLSYELNNEIFQWVDEKEAMQMLKITSKTTFQKYLEEGVIDISKITTKQILYRRQSILDFIESKRV